MERLEAYVPTFPEDDSGEEVETEAVVAEQVEDTEQEVAQLGEEPLEEGVQEMKQEQTAGTCSPRTGGRVRLAELFIYPSGQ